MLIRFLSDILFSYFKFSDFLLRSCFNNASLVFNVLILVFPYFFVSRRSIVFWCFVNFPLFLQFIMTWTWAISVLILSILFSRFTIYFGFSCFRFVFFLFGYCYIIHRFLAGDGYTVDCTFNFSKWDVINWRWVLVISFAFLSMFSSIFLFAFVGITRSFNSLWM